MWRRRHRLDQRQGFRVVARPVLREQPRQDGRVVVGMTEFSEVWAYNPCLGPPARRPPFHNRPRGPTASRHWTTHYLNAEAEHYLDWFHLTMQLTVMGQYAKGLATTPE